MLIGGDEHRQSRISQRSEQAQGVITNNAEPDGYPVFSKASDQMSGDRGFTVDQWLSAIGHEDLLLARAGSSESAAREGFEPPEGFPSGAFKAPAFGRSATSPGAYIP